MKNSNVLSEEVKRLSELVKILRYLQCFRVRNSVGKFRKWFRNSASGSRTSGNWIFQCRWPPENSTGVCWTAFQNLKCSPVDYSLFRNSNTHVYHSRRVAVVHRKLREKIESGFVPQGLKSTMLRVVSL